MSDQNETPDLATVLEECAEHLRAKRDPCAFFEVRERRDFREAASVTSLVSAAAAGPTEFRRKRPTITINGTDVLAPDGVIWTDIEKEASGIGERTTVQVEMYFNSVIRNEDVDAIIAALRGA